MYFNFKIKGRSLQITASQYPLKQTKISGLTSVGLNNDAPYDSSKLSYFLKC